MKKAKRRSTTPVEKPLTRAQMRKVQKLIHSPLADAIAKEDAAERRNG